MPGQFVANLIQSALLAWRIKREPADKPGSVVDSHSSGMSVAEHLKQPTRIRCGPHQRIPIWSCSGWGLPCHRCCHRRGALLPHHFTLTARRRRYIFCGTSRRLSPPRRYLAPCPVEPGLSSARNANSDCLADSRPAFYPMSGHIALFMFQRDRLNPSSCSGRIHTAASCARR